MFALEIFLALARELPSFLDMIVRHALNIIGAM